MMTPDITEDQIVLLCLAIITFTVCYKVVNWLLLYFPEQRARALLADFGRSDSDLRGELIRAGVATPDGKPIPRAGAVRGWNRVRPQHLREMAYGLADEAYLQYGRRDKSQANDLITRKFLRDQLSQFDSLRARDRSSVIDLALTLSYVPTSEWCEMEEVESTRAYRSLVHFSKSAHC